MIVIEPNGFFSHIVIKYSDCKNYLSEEEMSLLESLIKKISEGREATNKTPVNNYYICNLDEPYAEYVKSIIEIGESKKKLS